MEKLDSFKIKKQLLDMEDKLRKDDSLTQTEKKAIINNYKVCEKQLANVCDHKYRISHVNCYTNYQVDYFDECLICGKNFGTISKIIDFFQKKEIEKIEYREYGYKNPYIFMLDLEKIYKYTDSIEEALKIMKQKILEKEREQIK